MRSNISTICSLPRNPNALAEVYYDYADTALLPTSTPWDRPDPGTCSNDDLSLTVPSYQIPAMVTTEFTQDINIGFGANASNVYLWTVNGQT